MNAIDVASDLDALRASRYVCKEWGFDGILE